MRFLKLLLTWLSRLFGGGPEVKRMTTWTVVGGPRVTDPRQWADGEAGHQPALVAASYPSGTRANVCQTDPVGICWPYVGDGVVWTHAYDPSDVRPALTAQDYTLGTTCEVTTP